MIEIAAEAVTWMLGAAVVTYALAAAVMGRGNDVGQHNKGGRG